MKLTATFKDVQDLLLLTVHSDNYLCSETNKHTKHSTGLLIYIDNKTEL